ncbi:MAG: NADH-quinone oxidoreductase subunit G, partial [Pseudomonadota bacterium]
AMVAAFPHLGHMDEVVPGDPAAVTRLAALAGPLEDSEFINPVAAFHLTNPIARASKVMADCARTFDEPALRVAAE